MKKNKLITVLAFISVLSYGMDNEIQNLRTSNSILGGEKPLVVGLRSTAADDERVTKGKDAKAEGEKAIAIGNEANTKGKKGIAMGVGAHAGASMGISSEVENAVAIGTGAKATADDAIAIGNKANAQTKYGIAIGTETSTDGIGAIALGYKSKANSDSIAIGKSAESYGKGISIGENTHSRRSTVVIGNGATSKGVYSHSNVAIGHESTVGENLINAMALGAKSKVEERYSIALGANSVAKQRDDRYGIDMLTDKKAEMKDKLSEADNTKYLNLKSELKTMIEESEKLQKEVSEIMAKDVNSRTDEEKNKLTDLVQKRDEKTKKINEKYKEYAKLVKVWRSTYGELSIGDAENGLTRQLTGLAAGLNDTDAVNVAQLKSLAKKLENENKTYFHVNTGENKDTGNKDTNLGKLGDSAGATGMGSITVGMNAKASELNSMALGTDSNASGLNSLSIGRLANSSGINSIAIGVDSKASGISSLSFGIDSKASGMSSVAIGATSKSLGYGSVSLGSSSSSKGNHSVAIGGLASATIEKSVALGSESETTKATATKEVKIGDLTFGEFAGHTPTSVVSIGFERRERQLQYVAAGQITKTSTDAINGSQLYATNSILEKFINSTKGILGGNANVTTSGDEVGKLTMSNIGDTGKDNIHDAIKSIKEKEEENKKEIEKVDKKIDKTKEDLEKKIDDTKKEIEKKIEDI
ncbi:hypothetical protein, partial [Streptobacillus ratti]